MPRTSRTNPRSWRETLPEKLPWFTRPMLHPEFSAFVGAKDLSTKLPAEGNVLKRTTLRRIQRLVIPPAWSDVWICPQGKGHLQATGRDAAGRKQYLYHPRWRSVRDKNKFERMAEFGRALPRIRRRVVRDLRQPGITRTKVLATVVRLLEESLIRVGNEEYARTNYSFGLTTLKNRHATVSGATICFQFRGKSGKTHSIDVHDKKIAKIIRQCQDLPGHDLFEYLDGDGIAHGINSGQVKNTFTRSREQSSRPRIFAPGPEYSLPLRSSANPKRLRNRRLRQPSKRWRNNWEILRRFAVTATFIPSCYRVRKSTRSANCFMRPRIVGAPGLASGRTRLLLGLLKAAATMKPA